MKRLLAGLLLGWFVMTLGGKKLMGPFDFLADCDAQVRAFTARGITVSYACRFFSDN